MQSGAARNGYSFTQGQFKQESQLEFETGTFVFLHICKSIVSVGQRVFQTFIDLFKVMYISRKALGAWLVAQLLHDKYIVLKIMQALYIYHLCRICICDH